MTVIASLFEHQDFTGATNTFVANTHNRYRGVRLGNLANKVTSLRATSSDGMHGNTYGFTGRDFDDVSGSEPSTSGGSGQCRAAQTARSSSASLTVTRLSTATVAASASTSRDFSSGRRRSRHRRARPVNSPI